MKETKSKQANKHTNPNQFQETEERKRREAIE